MRHEICKCRIISEIFPFVGVFLILCYFVFCRCLGNKMNLEKISSSRVDAKIFSDLNSTERSTISNEHLILFG